MNNVYPIRNDEARSGAREDYIIDSFPIERYADLTDEPRASEDDGTVYAQEIADHTNTARVSVWTCDDGTYGTLQLENNEGTLRAMILNLDRDTCDALANYLLDAANLLEEAEVAGRLL